MKAVLSLSGGMDSSCLLMHYLANDYDVLAVSFDYGQRHRFELEQAKALVQYLKTTPYGDRVEHHTITLGGLTDLLFSALTGQVDVPEGHYEEQSMKVTVVPNRNKIFSSILQAIALSYAIKHDTEVIIGLGIHSGDHEIYPDCRPEFRSTDFRAFRVGNWKSERVKSSTPYLRLDKYTILLDTLTNCERLNLNFDQILKRTNTSYKPIKIEGVWYSDYKSSSSIERIEAFIKLGRPDPVQYADESGQLVSWETVKKHAEKVLENAPSK